VGSAVKYLLIAAGVLLVALLLVFYLRPAADDPQLKELGGLVALAERTCLSNTSETQTANLKLSLDAISSGVHADADVARGQDAVRGAALALPDAVKKLENDDIRKCMEPWAEKIRALATGLPVAPAK